MRHQQTRFSEFHYQSNANEQRKLRTAGMTIQNKFEFIRLGRRIQRRKGRNCSRSTSIEQSNEDHIPLNENDMERSILHTLSTCAQVM